MATTIKLKQLSLPAGITTTAVQDGQALAGTEAAELVAGKDGAGAARFIATETDGRVKVSDAGGSLTVDGTVTANIGTVNGLATDAVLTGGTAKSIVRGGAKGATSAADVTSTVEGTDHQALDVQIYHSGVAKDPTQIRALTSSDQVTIANASLAVTAAALPLPTGAATSAKQPAFGTAGTPSTDVLTVQGISSMTALKVDGSATTQPVSGTVTANISSSGPLALDATLTGGSQKTIARGGTKGATVTAADITSTAEGADHQALDVQLYHSGTAVNPTQIRALTSSDVVTSAQGTAGALTGAWPVKVTDGTNVMPTGDAAARAVFYKLTDGTNTASVVGTALKVDGSAVTQPVSGTVTANISSPGTLALDATLTGGNQLTKITDGSNIATVKAASTAAVASDKALVVAVHPSTGVTQGAAAVTSSAWPTKITDGTSIATVKAASTASVTTDLALVTAIHPLSNAIKVTDGTNTANVKAASTAPVAADPALVVAISPNSSLPISGTVTANIGTAGSLALDATLTGGSAKAVVRGGAKAATAAADVTSTASGANHQALDVILYDTNGNPLTNFNGGVQYTSGTVQATPTGTVALGYDGTNVRAFAVDSGGKVTISISDISGLSGSLGALNATASISLQGRQGAGVKLSPSAFTGTLVPEFSVDLGSTYSAGLWFDSLTGVYSTSLSLSASSTVVYRSFLIPPGATNVRVRTSAWTSGTCSSTGNATNVTGNLPRTYGATTASVAVSTTSVTLLAYNLIRQRAIIWNASGQTLYIAFGLTATTAAGGHTLQVANGAREVIDTYQGYISGILSTGSGSVSVTEVS